MTIESTIDPPFPGVDQGEWTRLIDRGDAAGVLHAEAITHVLRHVELTGDVTTAFFIAGIDGSIDTFGI